MKVSAVDWTAVSSIVGVFGVIAAFLAILATVAVYLAMIDRQIREFRVRLGPAARTLATFWTSFSVPDRSHTIDPYSERPLWTATCHQRPTPA